MKIVASPTARLAVFEPTGQIIRHRYLTAEGLFDARIGAVIAPCVDVPEGCAPRIADYYSQALLTGDAVHFTDPAKATKPAPRPKEV